MAGGQDHPERKSVDLEVAFIEVKGIRLPGHLAAGHQVQFCQPGTATSAGQLEAAYFLAVSLFAVKPRALLQNGSQA